jgi:hypothetical protein
MAQPLQAFHQPRHPCALRRTDCRRDRLGTPGQPPPSPRDLADSPPSRLRGRRLRDAPEPCAYGTPPESSFRSPTAQLHAAWSIHPHAALCSAWGHLSTRDALHRHWPSDMTRDREAFPRNSQRAWPCGTLKGVAGVEVDRASPRSSPDVLYGCLPQRAQHHFLGCSTGRSSILLLAYICAIIVR